MLLQAVAILLALLFARTIYRLTLHPLADIPGPLEARISSTWRDRKYLAGTWLEDIIALHRQYGPVVRITPNTVAFVDLAALKAIYGLGKTASPKSSWYSVWGMTGGVDNLFVAQTPSIHRKLRSRVSAIYAMSNMVTQEEYVQPILDTVWRQFSQRAGEVIDLDQWVSWFTYDVVFELGCGGAKGNCEQARDVIGIVEANTKLFALLSNFGYWPLSILSSALKSNTFQAFDSWLNPGGPLPMTMKIMEDAIRQRYETKNADASRRDFLAAFIETDNGNMRFEDVREEMANLLFAGADTTSVAIRACLGALITHPPCLVRLRKELDDACEESGVHHELSYSAASKLPYLVAVIKEATRLHPSIVYQLPRLAPPEGIVIAGHYIPGFAEVGMSPAANNRNTDVFGHDANKFRPERWLASEASPDQLSDMNNGLATFGYGVRSCVGRNLALFETTKYIAQAVRLFDFDLGNPDCPWKNESIWFCSQKEFNVRIRPRAI